ncbi:MAG: hypothetical protein HFI88_03845 [Lachnospiraceae bacterium]|nr:hypothetical protein [Lachnospiraceae bacterium]
MSIKNHLRKTYKIQVFYSLEGEKSALDEMSKRLNIVKEKICRTEGEAILSDWQNIEVDLNDAICGYERRFRK